jgi:hypothetical protein
VAVGVDSGSGSGTGVLAVLVVMAGAGAGAVVDGRVGAVLAAGVGSGTMSATVPMVAVGVADGVTADCPQPDITTIARIIKHVRVVFIVSPPVPSIFDASFYYVYFSNNLFFVKLFRITGLVYLPLTNYLSPYTIFSEVVLDGEPAVPCT